LIYFPIFVYINLLKFHIRLFFIFDLHIFFYNHSIFHYFKTNHFSKFLVLGHIFVEVRL